MTIDDSPSSQVNGRRRRPLYKDLSLQILVAMLLGALVGYLWPQSADSMRPLGDLFIRLVRMIVAPIIFCTVVHGIASVGEAKRVGRVAMKALIYFEIVTTIALVLGLVLVNIWAPGAGMNVDPATLADSAAPTSSRTARPVGYGEFLLSLVPTSAVGAFAEGDVLPVLFFSVMFAFALLALGPKGEPIVDAIHAVSQVLFKMIAFAMYVAPIGAFGAIAFTVGRFGPSSLLALGNLVLMFYVLCALFVLLVLWPIAWGFGINMLRLVRYIGAELMIVVGTSSSESVFPRLHAKLRQLGVDPPVVALVLPAGYAFNHDGTCLYFATRLGVPRAGRRDRSVDRPAAGAARDPAGHVEGRRRGCRFGHRRPRIHAGRHGDDPGGERRPDPGRASSAVVGLRAGQRARQRDRDAGDRPHGAGARCADVRIRASPSGRSRRAG